MPEIIPVSRIITMDEDALVSGARGILKTLYERKSGSGENGEWSFQNGVLKDASGEIKVTFKDRDEVPKTWKGHAISITAYHGPKGWSGAYRKLDTYKDKNLPLLWITKTAEVTLDDPNLAPPAKPASQPALPNATAPATPPITHAQTEEALRKLKGIVGKRLSALKVCFKGVSHFASEVELTKEMIQALTISLFISAERNHPEIVEALPFHVDWASLAAAKAPKKETPPQPPPPQPEPSTDKADDDNVPF